MNRDIQTKVSENSGQDTAVLTNRQALEANQSAISYLYVYPLAERYEAQSILQKASNDLSALVYCERKNSAPISDQRMRELEASYLDARSGA